MGQNTAGRCYGLMVGLFGVVCVSPDACLMRIAQNAGASISALVFWKSFSKFLILFSLLSATMGTSDVVQSVKNGRQNFLMGALFMGGLELSFASMVLLTTAARGFLFYSLNPLFSALFGHFIIGDNLNTRSIVALIFATAAVFLTFAPGLTGQDDAEEAGASLAGDLCGIIAGLCQSAFICLVRYVHVRDLGVTTMVPSATAGSLTAILTAAWLAKSMGSDLLPNENASLQFFGSVAGSGLCVAILLVCLNIAPRTLSGAEVSLITLLETPLGPFCVFLWFGETPGPWTLAGGALLFITLVIHEAAGLFDRHEDNTSSAKIQYKAVDDEKIVDEFELKDSSCCVKTLSTNS